MFRADVVDLIDTEVDGIARLNDSRIQASHAAGYDLGLVRRFAEGELSIVNMNSKSNVWIAGLALIGAFALGFLLGRSDREPSAMPASSILEPLSPGLQPLTSPGEDRAAHELEGQIRALRADVASALQVERDRVPLGSNKDTSESDLAAAVRELATALREHAPLASKDAQVGTLGVTPLPAAAGFPSLEALLSNEREDEGALHLFWTMKDVVDRYGQPSSLTPAENGALKVRYVRGREADTRRRTFHVYNGQVIRVE